MSSISLIHCSFRPVFTCKRSVLTYSRLWGLERENPMENPPRRGHKLQKWRLRVNPVKILPTTSHRLKDNFLGRFGRQTTLVIAHRMRRAPLEYSKRMLHRAKSLPLQGRGTPGTFPYPNRVMHKKRSRSILLPSMLAKIMTRRTPRRHPLRKIQVLTKSR